MRKLICATFFHVYIYISEEQISRIRQKKKQKLKNVAFSFSFFFFLLSSSLQYIVVYLIFTCASQIKSNVSRAYNEISKQNNVFLTVQKGLISVIKSSAHDFKKKGIEKTNIKRAHHHIDRHTQHLYVQLPHFHTVQSNKCCFYLNNIELFVEFICDRLLLFSHAFIEALSICYQKWSYTMQEEKYVRNKFAFISWQITSNNMKSFGF